MADYTSFTVPTEPTFDQVPYVSSPSFTPTQGGGGGTPATYYQRVFSSGLGVWCYYSGTSIDETPAPGDTTPSWTGSITAYELLFVRP